jgi:acetolactate synthase-1/2/3 large subunit
MQMASASLHRAAVLGRRRAAKLGGGAPAAAAAAPAVTHHGVPLGRPRLLEGPGAARLATVQRRSAHASASASTVSSASVRSLEEELERLRSPVELSEDYVGMSGAAIFAQMMKDHGVEKIFGYPGGAILPVFDAIYEAESFDFILSRHEQGAGHMAQGYARVTGKPGVVLVTSGPGATNTITPMQDALMDGTPMIVFAGQVATTAIGTDAFQEADVMGIARPCTKWCVQVRDVRELPRRINEAFKIAMSGRPGPVIVDLPKDVTAAICHEAVSAKPQLPGLTSAHFEGALGPDAEEELAAAAELLNHAKRPVIFAGQGIQQGDAVEELRAVAERCQIPVTTSLQGLGCFDEKDPLSLQMLGMHGSATANYAIQSADVILGVGVRFDDRVTGRIPDFAPAARAAAAAGTGGIIHFDIMPKNISKVVTPDVAVAGNCKLSLGALLPMLDQREHAEWNETIRGWKRAYPFAYTPSEDDQPMKPQEVIQELDRQIAGRDDVIITTGVGQHQMFAAQFITWHRPWSWISSGGLGTMGFGVPAAVGAKIAAPHMTVIDIDGDGSFMMTQTEMATAAEYGVGVKILLLNNDFQGMVRQWQDLFYDERYSGTEMKNPDFVKLAEAMHCQGLRCRTRKDLQSKMTEFLETDQPIVGEFCVDKREHTLPMVPAGAKLHEMVLCEGQSRLSEAEMLGL